VPLGRLGPRDLTAICRRATAKETGDMKIGIFSKCHYAGGSEFRCAELANGIVRYTEHRAFLLCEGPIHPKILKTVDEGVAVRLNVVKIQDKVPILYDMDAVIVVNTDSNEFTDAAYWQGKTDRHSCVVDLARIKKFVFLFNFVIEPAAKLPSLLRHVPDVRIITANSLFFRAISEVDAFEAIRHLPRLVLASPIDPGTVTTYKKPADRIRIGQHSLPHTNKFNEEIGTLVARINDRYADRVAWHFMGIPARVGQLIAHHPNVVTREAFALPVGDFLKEVDVFLFYPAWDRTEPWARSVAEALASGAPVVATAKGGNQDQIVPGSNGYLCRCLEDFVRYLSAMIDRPETVRLLGRNASLYSRFFTTKHIIRDLLEYVR
jgi:glycosyltransferase involved in cell wall biosynthesis